MKKGGRQIPSRSPFMMNGTAIAAGESKSIDMRVAQLYTHTPLHIPVQVMHGRKEGPVLLVCAAIHGDEINGVEIIRRLLAMPVLGRLRALNRPRLQQALGRYLSSQQLDALEVRRTLLVKHFDGQIESRGEGVVLYDLPPRR